MASLDVVSLLQLGGGNDLNPLTISDDTILEQMYSNHIYSDPKFDVDSLFTIVDNIIKRSTRVVDSVVQGNHGSLEQIEKKSFPVSFTSPLCTLKQISSEMSCKAPGDDIAHKTTVAILKKLSDYSFVAKAVLTFAAFSLEYGEYWLLPQYLPTELAIIKRVPELTNPEALIKHRNAILELNNLVKSTWQVVDIIFEFEKLNSQHDIKDVPALAPALEKLPIHVYWAIITVAAIVTQIDCLTINSEKRQELSHFDEKINILLNTLRRQRTLINQQIEEVEYYKLLKKLFQVPTEILEVLKVLFFGKDTPHAPIYDGVTKTLVDIEVLKKKDVFLFISTLDISEEEISVLVPIYHHITRLGSQYKIVWVPIVEEWNDKLRNKFDTLISKMPWYVLHHFAPIKGIKYIKEEWQFKKKPLVVVLNSQAKVLHHNAFHMIQVWGLKGFPFTITIEQSLSQPTKIVMNGIDPTFNLVEKYVITYGGKDKEWIQQFTKYARALENDVIFKEARISIELLCLESQEPNIINNFWKGVEKFLVSKNKTTNAITHQLEKLLSNKNETGWALLNKGSTVVFVGLGTSVLKTVAEFDKWKGEAIIKGFEVAFKEYYENIASKGSLYSPQTIECPQCHGTVEVLLSYNFRHNGNMVNSGN